MTNRIRKKYDQRSARLRSREMLPYRAGRSGPAGICGCGAHRAQASLPRLRTLRRIRMAAIARIGNMNSDTDAPSGRSLPQIAKRECPGREDMRLIDRPAIRQDLDDVEIGEGHDQREQGRDLDDVAHHRQVDVPDLLEPVRAVDRRRLVQLIGHRFERRQIHDHEERRADPDIDQDDREARPIGIAEPRHAAAGRDGREPN